MRPLRALKVVLICIVGAACTTTDQELPTTWLAGRLNDREWMGIGKTHIYADGMVWVGGYRGGDDYCRTSRDCETITVFLSPGHPALTGGSGEVRAELARAYDGVVVTSYELMGSLSATGTLVEGEPWEGRLDLRSLEPGRPLVFRQARFHTVPQAMDVASTQGGAVVDTAPPSE